MIDFANLQPLPLRRQKEACDRERLAEAAHRKKCAKHKGRNHWRNWERRKMALAKIAEGKIAGAKWLAARRRHVDQVRAYWEGLRSDHPH